MHMSSEISAVDRNPRARARARLANRVVKLTGSEIHVKRVSLGFDVA